MNLKIIGVSGSPRHANTEVMVKHALEAAKSIETPEVSVETQFISLAQKNVRGCLNCRGCVRTGKCVLKDDWDELFRPLYDPMPDGVIFGASVYFYGINSQMRAYMERATSLLKANFFPEATTKPRIGASASALHRRWLRPQRRPRAYPGSLERLVHHQ